MEIMMIFNLPTSEITDEIYVAEDIKSIQYLNGKGLHQLWLDFKDGGSDYTNSVKFIDNIGLDVKKVDGKWVTDKNAVIYDDVRYETARELYEALMEDEQ